jgi:hypothetical protein
MMVIQIKDNFGKYKNINLDDIRIYDTFEKIIREIRGENFFNYLNWDSYILEYMTKQNPHTFFLGTIDVIYNNKNNKFETTKVNSNFINTIIQLCNNVDTSTKKIIFNLDITFNGYRHTNTILLHPKKKTLDVFEPWGKINNFGKNANIYNNAKKRFINKLFNSDIKYKYNDIAKEYSIYGPQSTRKNKKMYNFDHLEKGSFMMYQDNDIKNGFYFDSNENKVAIYETPKRNPHIFSINRDNHTFYDSTGFDLSDGICDIFCFYFSALSITNPDIDSKYIHKYLSEGNSIHVQRKVIKVIHWIIQWFNYQIKIMHKKRLTPSFKMKHNKSAKLVFDSIDQQFITKYNTLSKQYKKQHITLAQEYCRSINMDKIYNWMRNYLAAKHNINESFVDYIMSKNTKIDNKCITFLSIKNIYDMFLIQRGRKKKLKY